jgi:predicted dehydrogenase
VNKVRTAVVGPGRISRAHLSAIRNNAAIAELSLVVGLPEEEPRTRELAAEYGARAFSNDLDAVLAGNEVDAVVLTLPNHLHEPVAVKALGLGKHVLVEKPLANTVQEADRMIAAADRSKRILMTAQCRRFFPGALEAKRQIANLGRPLDVVHILGVKVEAAKAEWWRSAAKTGGLAFGLNGPHVIDTILWLVGERPVRVYAQSGRFKPQHWEGEDEATIMLNFADGSMATGHISFHTTPDTNERWAIGPNGSLHLSHDRTLHVNGEPVVQAELTSYITGDVSFDAQFKELASAIREKRQPMASGQETRAVVEVLAAALESAKTNLPVDL